MWFYVYYIFVVAYVVSMETRIMCCSYRGHFEFVYHLHVHETEFCVFASPAVWWRSVELKRGSVTFGSDGMTQLKYSIRYENCEILGVLERLPKNIDLRQ
jgi:hypothetical protein